MYKYGVIAQNAKSVSFGCQIQVQKYYMSQMDLLRHRRGKETVTAKIVALKEQLLYN